MDANNGMELVIVERVYAEPVSIAAVQRALSVEHACFASRRIRHLRTILSHDGKRMICEYEAPDAESVRVANRQADLPFERVWSARQIERAD